MHSGWRKLITTGKKILEKEDTFNPHGSKGFGWEREAQVRKWKGRGEKIEQLPARLAVGTSNIVLF